MEEWAKKDVSQAKSRFIPSGRVENPLKVAVPYFPFTLFGFGNGHIYYMFCPIQRTYSGQILWRRCESYI